MKRPCNNLTQYPGIHYVKAANQWCLLYTDEGNVLIRGGIAALEEKLPGFIRPHRSYLVNPGFIASLKRYQITLISGEQIPVSKAKYMNVKIRLGLKEAGHSSKK